MKKVRFILKAREQGGATSESPNSCLAALFFAAHVDALRSIARSSQT